MEHLGEKEGAFLGCLRPGRRAHCCERRFKWLPHPRPILCHPRVRVWSGGRASSLCALADAALYRRTAHDASGLHLLLVSLRRTFIDCAPDFPSVVLMSVRKCGGWGGESVQTPYLPVLAQCATRFRPRHHVGAAAAVGWPSTPPPWRQCVRSVAGGGMAGDVAADGRVLRDVSIAVVAATVSGGMEEERARVRSMSIGDATAIVVAVTGGGTVEDVSGAGKLLIERSTAVLAAVVSGSMEDNVVEAEKVMVDEATAVVTVVACGCMTNVVTGAEKVWSVEATSVVADVFRNVSPTRRSPSCPPPPVAAWPTSWRGRWTARWVGRALLSVESLAAAF